MPPHYLISLQVIRTDRANVRSNSTVLKFQQQKKFKLCFLQILQVPFSMSTKSRTCLNLFKPCYLLQFKLQQLHQQGQALAVKRMREPIVTYSKRYTLQQQKIDTLCFVMNRVYLFNIRSDFQTHEQPKCSNFLPSFPFQKNHAKQQTMTRILAPPLAYLQSRPQKNERF